MSIALMNIATQMTPRPHQRLSSTPSCAGWVGAKWMKWGTSMVAYLARDRLTDRLMAEHPTTVALQVGTERVTRVSDAYGRIVCVSERRRPFDRGARTREPRACAAPGVPQRLAMYPPAANTKITISMQMAGRAMPGS
jgi:hypothetical protein